MTETPAAMANLAEEVRKMMEPTEKQRAYAYDIARWLDISLPKEKTKSAYADFISKNVDEFKRVKMANYFADSDYFGEMIGMGIGDLF